MGFCLPLFHSIFLTGNKTMRLWWWTVSTVAHHYIFLTTSRTINMPLSWLAVSPQCITSWISLPLCMNTINKLGYRHISVCITNYWLICMLWWAVNPVWYNLWPIARFRCRSGTFRPATSLFLINNLFLVNCWNESWNLDWSFIFIIHMLRKERNVVSKYKWSVKIWTFIAANY